MNIIRRPFRYVNLNTVYWLIGINALIFFITFFLRGSQLSALLYDIMPMRPYRIIKSGWVWTFITYMFMHGGISHLFFNMLGLFIFGVHVERQMGSKEFLLYYFLTGALAGVFSFFVYYITGPSFEELARYPPAYRYGIALIGASGALYAVQLAYAVFFPNSVIYIWGIIPLRAPIMVLAFTVLSLFFIITGGGGNVAHITHLAGFAFGWVYFLIRFGVNPLRRLLGR